MELSEQQVAQDRVLQALAARGEAFLRRFGDERPAQTSVIAEATVSPSVRTKGPVSIEATADEDDERSADEELDFAPRKQPGNLPATSATPLNARKSKRLFLSGKTPEELSSPQQKAHKRKGDMELTQETFRTMQREVGALGALGLDKKSQKKIAADRLKSLNAKTEKGPRTPASIGKRTLANRVKREQKDLEEGVESGMIHLKGMGKRKRRHNEMERRKQPGLREDGGAFRNGKLDLRFLKGPNNLQTTKPRRK